MFKSAFIIMAPDGDPAKHHATVKTEKAEVTTVFIEMTNFDQAVEVAKDFVQNKGVRSIYLCAGFYPPGSGPHCRRCRRTGGGAGGAGGWPQHSDGSRHPDQRRVVRRVTIWGENPLLSISIHTHYS